MSIWIPIAVAAAYALLLWLVLAICRMAARGEDR
jgi:hypothetical protein